MCFSASQRLLGSQPPTSSQQIGNNEAGDGQLVPLSAEPMPQEANLNVSANLRDQSKELWDTAIEKLMAEKSRMLLKTQSEVDNILGILRQAKNGTKFSREQYHEHNILKRYRYVVNDDESLTLLTKNEKKVPVKEELFDLFYRIHKRKGHGGIGVMYKAKALKNYDGITKELIGIFVQCCQSCELKKNKVKKGITVKPIISVDFNKRCQMDLIDLQSKPDGEFKFILNYQDHFTKYCLLRPLKAKTADAVAQQLKFIISDFGPPDELQTDNGREFKNSTIETIIKSYGGQLIHGKARHSQSQGSIERANRDVQNILTILMRRKNTPQWAELLPQVQLMKNSRYHLGIKNTPYKALFGRDSVYEDDNVEEELKKLEAAEESEEEEKKEGSDSEGEEKKEGSDSEGEEKKEGSDSEGEESENQHKLREDKIKNARLAVGVALNNQASTMLRRSENAFAPLAIGESVLLPVPDVDRGKVDHRNVVGVILQKQNNFYKVGTSSGILKDLFARNQLQPSRQQFLRITDVPQIQINSIRTAATEASVSGGQGVFHCMCTTGCTGCFKNFSPLKC
uniref:Integrase catalytic domain-containing protein n=1 Tax=Panagrolaimus davidi TaxID=227884 RepID=A0A914PYY8_9BILA